MPDAVPHQIIRVSHASGWLYEVVNALPLGFVPPTQKAHNQLVVGL
ncbi:hypothetical protein N806_10270 [Rhodococcus sp. P27]|nr:hypothetical protein N806_10270 [Rhodococcus sp. P27]